MNAKRLFGKGHIALLAIALSIFAFIALACDGGTIPSGVCTENVTGINRASAAKLYYPCNLSHPTGATTMAGGFVESLEDVEWLSSSIAQAGFVVLAFTPANKTGMVDQWRDAHKDCIKRLITLNGSHAKLRGLIDTTKLQTCGHSKGGGGSVWASAQLQGQLKTTVGMAPWMEEYTPSTLRSISAATLIQAGSTDSLAVGPMTKAIYGGLGNIPKCYREYPNYGHIAWWRATGVVAKTLSGDIISWMKYYMNGEGSRPAQCGADNGGSNSSSSGGGCN